MQDLKLVNLEQALLFYWANWKRNNGTSVT